MHIRIIDGVFAAQNYLPFENQFIGDVALLRGHRCFMHSIQIKYRLESIYVNKNIFVLLKVHIQWTSKNKLDTSTYIVGHNIAIYNAFFVSLEN